MKKSTCILPTIIGITFASSLFAANTFPGSGRVGIGTTSPDNELHVEGWTRIGMADRPDSYLNLEAQDGFHRMAFHQLRFYDWDLGKDIITFNNGRVGIGTISPDNELHVEGWIRVGMAGRPDSYLNLEAQDGFHRMAFHQLRFYDWDLGKDIITFNNGNIGIGTTNPTNPLSVNGTIKAKEIIVETGWADFVFEDGYELRSLSEVENHIEEHGHLPDVPSALDVESEGLSVGEAQQIMMQKIEELTLYAIEQQKMLELQQKKIGRLEASSQ